MTPKRTTPMRTYDDCPPVVRDFLYYLLTIRGRSPRTVDAYYIDLRTFLRYIKIARSAVPIDAEFTKIEINDVSPDMIRSITLSDVYAFLNFALSERENSAKTRARKVSSIRAFFKFLTVKTGMITEDPVKNLEMPTAKKAMPKYLTLEESIDLINSVETIECCAAERDACILTLFLNCGMRLSELVGINVGDIRGNTVKLLGKGNKERIVYLNEACLKSLQRYIAVRPAPASASEKGALFLSKNRKRLTPRRVQQIVENSLRMAGLSGKGYSPHKLRHTAATLMYQHGGVDIRVLKEILGHSNLSTTEIYTHVSDKQIENAANSSPLAKIVAPKGIPGEG